MDSTTSRREALAARRARLSGAAREVLAARVRGEAPVQAAPACAVQLAGGAGTPLFCVHPAGGDVLCYATVASRLHRPLYGLQTPGLASDPLPEHTIPALAAHYADAIDAVHPDGPVAVAGWSLGAHVAHELGHVLAARGRPAAAIVLVDADPSVPTADELPTPATRGRGPSGSGVRRAHDRLRARPDPRSAAVGARGLRAPPRAGDVAVVGAYGAVASEERLVRLLAVFEANTRALARHRPRVVDAPLTLLQCRGAGFEQGWAR
ncbi:MAG: thioesterase domain-containing protein [Myxococcota bacterium]